MVAFRNTARASRRQHPLLVELLQMTQCDRLDMTIKFNTNDVIQCNVTDEIHNTLP